MKYTKPLLILLAYVLTWSIALSLGSCSKDAPPKTLIEHEQGKHQEKHSKAVKDLLRSKNKDGDTYHFQFTESCKYSLPRPNGEGFYLGFSKILGSAGVNIHCRSLRLAWRYDCTKDLFEVASYRYWNCDRDWEILASGKVGETITVEGFKLKHSFYATAYFGGVYVAPHYMFYYIW